MLVKISNTWRYAIAGIALTVLVTKSQAQVVINEVMADNRTAVEHGNNNFLDFVELRNNGAGSVSIAGMSLTDDPALPRKFIFPAGTSINGGSYLIVWCAPPSGASGLHSGFGLGAKTDQVRLYAANGTTLLDSVAFGLQVGDLSVGRVPDGTGAWTLTTPTLMRANTAQPLGGVAELRINEWMARPSMGEDWIEIYNASSLPVDVSQLVLTDQASGVPGNRPIPALSFVGARGYLQMFASDLQEMDADHLDFKLGSDGETLTLYGANKTTIIDRVVFGSQTPDISQGRSPDGSDNIVYFPADRSTPGDENVVPLTSVVISEVLSHTDPPLEDAIELYNPTAAPVDIGYWWLSDSPANPKKYRIPAGTVIGGGEYYVVYQNRFDAGANAFSLNSYDGDEVVLSAANSSGTLLGQQSVVEFGALINGVSAGRYVTSVGVDFVPLSARSFGQDNPSSLSQFRQGNGLANPGPLIGPAVISEFLFDPLDEDEFLELHNPTSGNVRLYDPDYPTNTWRLRNAVRFDFPMNITLPAGGYLLVVNFDPGQEPARLAAFRTRYAVPAGISVIGPYDGQLSDNGEAIDLLQPDHPELLNSPKPGFVPYQLVERIDYKTSSPWPTGATGTGHALQRRQMLSYANEPLNWMTGAPTPGRGVSSDSDADGMPNDWETTHGFNPNFAGDADQDPDGDGLTNLEEYRAGTLPNSTASVLKLLKVEMISPLVRLSFLAVQGKVYAIESATDINGAWIEVARTTPAPTTGVMQADVSVPADTIRFYRITLP